ncbi:MAG: thioester reductase domain-containing protein [Thermosynechococcaceae cyanobacterium]
MVNAYGPTESTIVVTCCDIAGSATTQPQDNRVPIGQPLRNIQVHILNSDLEPVQNGSAGELYIGGMGLARGYLNRPDLTDSKFIFKEINGHEKIRLYKTADLVRYRNDGHLEFLDRIDHQVKIRGFRIDLQEIETVLGQHPLVDEALVVAKEDAMGQKHLVAYILQKQKKSAQNKIGRHSIETEQMNQWRLIHNSEQLNPAKNNWDKTFNISGWISSYTGELIPDHEMQEWVDNTIERIQALHPKRVLEIGCGTGLLLFRLAPQCASYLGTDFSETALHYVEQQLNGPSTALPQVLLEQRRADDFKGIQPQSFDTVILNSVLQYFPSVDYLLEVLENAIQAVQPGGSLFIGDIRSYPLLEAFAASVELSHASDDLSTRELWQNICNRLHREEELTLDPAFFTALQQRLPQITEVQVLLKQGKFQNELTRFRYDVILKIGSTPHPLLECPRLDWQQQNLSLSKLNELLQNEHYQTFIVSGIPNTRVLTAVHTVQELKSPSCPANTRLLKQKLSQIQPERSIDPQDIWQLSQTMPYNITVSWINSDTEGSYQVLFERVSEQLLDSCMDSLHSQELENEEAHVEILNHSPKISQIKLSSLHKESNQIRLSQPKGKNFTQHWSVYANNPLKTKIDYKLSVQLRTYLQQFPNHMRPSAFVVLDSFPLTPNGKVDRRALPTPSSNRPMLSTEFVAPTTTLEQELARMWSQILEIDEIGVKDSFLELGGDSLRLIQLASQLETSYSVTLSIVNFFESPTILGLIQQIQKSDVLKRPPSSEYMTLKQLQSEVYLDKFSEIKNQDLSIYINPKSIFLTGATGFIGVFILYELLQQTEGIVYCLVRADSTTQAYQRLRYTFQRYLPGVGFPYSRITPVIGDITRPLLGLSKENFEKLAQTIDSIYHCAANVNLLYPYSALKAGNVIGTKSIIKLAIYIKTKPVHYISTLDVFESLAATGVPVIYEDDSIAQGNGIAGGYSQSKWVAERLMTEASAKGLPTCIYRPGMVTGHHQTGVANPDDLMSRLLRSFMQLQCVPDLGLALDMTPVDYVSKAMVYLSLKLDSFGNYFHLTNPNSVDINKLIYSFNKLGTNIKKIEFDKWKFSILNNSNALKPLANIITESIYDNTTRLDIWLAGSQKFDHKNTINSLLNSDIVCPAIDYQTISKYLFSLGKEKQNDFQKFNDILVRQNE